MDDQKNPSLKNRNPRDSLLESCDDAVADKIIEKIPKPDNATEEYFFVHENHPVVYLRAVLGEVFVQNPSLMKVYESYKLMTQTNPVWKATYENSHVDIKNENYRSRVVDYYRTIPLGRVKGPGISSLYENNSSFFESEKITTLSFGANSYVKVSLTELLFVAYLIGMFQTQETEAESSQSMISPLLQKMGLESSPSNTGGNNNLPGKEVDSSEIKFQMRFTKRWNVSSYDEKQTFSPTPTLETIMTALEGGLFISRHKPFASDIILVPIWGYFHAKIFDSMLKNPPTDLWFIDKKNQCISIRTMELLSSLKNMADQVLAKSRKTYECY